MTDLISRQVAINGADEIIRRDRSGNNDVVKAMTAWKEWVKAMPSAYPKKGKLIKHGAKEGYLNPVYTCSECGEYLGRCISINFCSNCGANMRESE